MVNVASVGSAMLSTKLLLVLPLAAYCADGTIRIDAQALNGIRQWLNNFDTLTVCLQERPLAEAPSSTAMYRDSDFDGRCSVITLKSAYHPVRFFRALPSTIRLLGAEIDKATHLSFAIGGLFGDWAAVATLLAARKGRTASVWTDRVEHRVARFAASQATGLRKPYFLTLSYMMQAYEIYVVRRAPIGLFHGADCFEYYRKYSPNPHLVHNIHLSKSDHIPQQQLADKLRTIPERRSIEIIYIGRVHQDKGVFDWIETLEILRNKGITFHARWYGDGPLLDQARSKVRDLGLDQNVSFPGLIVDRVEIYSRLRNAAIFMFCHRTPESPRCLIEALVSGTPIVGYESGFPRDLIGVHQGGALTQHVPQQLADAIADLHADPARLADLTMRAAKDGHPFSDEEVFRHRSDIIKRFTA